MLIDPAFIVPLPRSIQSVAALRRAIGFEDMAGAHPGYEIFVVWHRQDPANPFALVMRISKARIARDGWPLIVDPETRVVSIDPAVKD